MTEQTSNTESSQGRYRLTAYYSKKTIKEMVELAKRLSLEGKSHVEIGQEWHKLGFSNPITNKPITDGAISRMLIDAGFRKARYGDRASKRKAKGTYHVPVSKKTDDVSRVEAIIQSMTDILTSPGLGDDTKIEVCRALAKNI